MRVGRRKLVVESWSMEACENIVLVCLIRSGMPTRYEVALPPLGKKLRLCYAREEITVSLYISHLL